MTDSMLLNDKRVRNKSKGKYGILQFNVNGNTTYQNIWDKAKKLLRGNFESIHA
jgi:hypothetical protein